MSVPQRIALKTGNRRLSSPEWRRLGKRSFRFQFGQSTKYLGDDAIAIGSSAFELPPRYADLDFVGAQFQTSCAQKKQRAKLGPLLETEDLTYLVAAGCGHWHLA